MNGVWEQTANEPVYVRWYQAASRRESRRRGRSQRQAPGISEVYWKKDAAGTVRGVAGYGPDPFGRASFDYCEETYSALIRQTYVEKGYFIIAEGWCCADGRADVVACDGRTLVFGFAERFPELPDLETIPEDCFPGGSQSADIARAFLEEYRWYGIPIRFDVIACGRQREEEKILIRSSSARMSSSDPDFLLLSSEGALSSQ